MMDMSNDILELFRMFDRNGDGRIDHAELSLMLESLDERWTPDRLTRLFGIIDKNGTGTIDYDEFVHWTAGGAEYAMQDQDVAEVSDASRRELARTPLHKFRERADAAAHQGQRNATAADPLGPVGVGSLDADPPNDVDAVDFEQPGGDGDAVMRVGSEDAEHADGASEGDSNEEQEIAGDAQQEAGPAAEVAGGKRGKKKKKRAGSKPRKDVNKALAAPKNREVVRRQPAAAPALAGRYDARPAAAAVAGPQQPQPRQARVHQAPSNPTAAAAALAARAPGLRQRWDAGGRSTVRCEKTLEFGKPIRNAICLRDEVWTVDWQGVVTIRDRDDASKTLGQIQTNRFVWSMLHMKPGLMWMGQEAHGIALFDSRQKKQCGLLMGGHSGGVTCMAVEENNAGNDDGEEIPERRVWTGSNDFTIREWWVLTWPSDIPPPDEMARNAENVTVELGPWSVGVIRGRCLHGHTNGVKALLKIGPVLWSGSDDGSIRLWRCADAECVEVIEDAHHGSVLKLAIVKASVWSAGSDGVVREWALGGRERTCTREVAPPGSEKGIYALLPLSRDVWVAGHHPMIQVFSRDDMCQVSEEEGHRPYISNLIAVDTVETKIVWSTSFGDRKLKVWKHTTRGDQQNSDEVHAANLMYQEEELKQQQKIGEFERKVDQLEHDVQQQAEGFQMQLEDATMQLANAKEECKSLKKKTGALEKKLDHLQQALRDHGLAQFADDPAGLKAFLERAAGIDNILRDLGLDQKSLGELAKILGSAGQLAAILEKHGLGGALDDPSVLDKVLDRHDDAKKAFEDRGLAEVFEDREKLEEFLDKYGPQQMGAMQAKVAELEHSMQDARAQLDALTRDLDQAHADDASMDEQLSRLQQELAALKSAFRDAGIAGLMSDPERMKAFLDRAAALERALREKGLEHLLDNPEDIAAKLALLQSLADVLRRCGFEHVLESPLELERALKRYSSMKAAFDGRGYPQLFEDPRALDAFLDTCKALEILRAVLEAAGLGETFRSPEKLERFLQGAVASKKVMDSLNLGHLFHSPEELREALENATAFKDLEEAFGALGLAEILKDPAAIRDFLRRADAMEKELPSLRQKAGRTDFLEKQMTDRDAELVSKNAKLAALEDADKKAADLERQMAKLMDELSHLRLLEEQGKNLARLREIFEESGFEDLLSDPEALEALLDQLAGLRDVFSGLGLDDLLDDPEELGRQLEWLQQVRDILKRYGFESAVDDASELVEVFSRYNDLKEACAVCVEREFMDIFDDPCSMKAFLKTYFGLRDEFANVGLERLMDSTRSMRDFLAKKLEADQELADLRKKVAHVKQLERLLEGHTGNAGVLSEYELIGSPDELRQWKEDAAELERVRHISDKLHRMIADLEAQLEQNEKERDEALERERLMAVKYKELDIFKLDVIARELKALDNELATLGRQAKDLENAADKIKDFVDQQKIANFGGSMLDECRALRAHIRDVINKCLTETQKMHIGVAIDDYLAAGELQDGGTMFTAVCQEIERPDHGNSTAAKLRQQDEVGRRRARGRSPH